MTANSVHPYGSVPLTAAFWSGRKDFKYVPPSCRARLDSYDSDSWASLRRPAATFWPSSVSILGFILLFNIPLLVFSLRRFSEGRKHGIRSSITILRSQIFLDPPKSMALTESEAIVLRTYPLREADLLVTLFTRAEGKVRGVARSAKKSKRRFGGALEPLTYVRAFYDVRERQELARLDACEVLESPLASGGQLCARGGAGACGGVA